MPSFGRDLRGYQHYDDDHVPYEEILTALDRLQRDGKVRAVGLSNETAYGTMRFLAAAEAGGGPRMASIQNAYSLVNRTFEYALAEVAMEEQVGLLAYSPLAQGALTGKYLGGARPAGSREADYKTLGRYWTPSGEDAIAAYVALADELGLDPAVLALQFVTTRPWVTSNIFGASSMAQLDTVFASLDLAWTGEIDAAVNAIHARWPNPCP